MNWFAKPDFWSLFYDWMFPAESFEQAIEQVDDIVNLFGVTKGAVLDLCCGPGRHSVPLSKIGFDVTGIDLQPLLLEKARDYAIRENVTIEFIEEDMRIFKRSESFDLIVNMFSSFGYFSDPAEDFRVLENAYYSLKNGGRILLDVRGKEIHAMENVEDYSHEMPNGDLVFHRTRVTDDWTRTISTWAYVRGGQAHTYEITFNLYSGAELRELLRKAGFRDVQLYGDLIGAPYNHKAKRLGALAEKR
jgi:SAM-dependent methyltransferase